MIIDKSNLELLQNDPDYQNFITTHPNQGTLKIRASSASEAIPIENVEITVSKKIGNNTIIFFKGQTDNSGMINEIKLPTTIRIQNNEEPPVYTTYQIHATYIPDNFDKYYDISLCCGISIIQYINITPNIEMRATNGN